MQIARDSEVGYNGLQPTRQSPVPPPPPSRANMLNASLLRFCVASGLLAFAASLSAAPPRKRFEAMFADGSRVEGNQLREWHANDTSPRLEDKPLLDRGNPFQWLIDRNLQPARDAYPAVELVNGDRLPGAVIQFRSDNDRPYPIRRDRFLVRPSVELRPPSSPPSAYVDVAAEYVRRIVWSESARRSVEPGNVFLRDGRKVSFRAIRYQTSGVRLRTDDGVRTLGFSELAELHLPKADSWEVHWNSLAELSPDGRARLLQLETSDGLIATTSMKRFRAFRRGSPTEFEKWVHGVQPAWSSQVLWTPSRNIWMRRSFAAHETPLSRIAPGRAESRSSLNGSPHPWRYDRNREGRPLRCGGRSYGWGFGGHAWLELEFPLHPLVRKLRTQFGLDYIAGDGGSVQGRVDLTSHRQAPRARLAESPPLIGRAEPHRFDVELKGQSPDRTLVLTIDPLNKSQPAGADPLDIRDAADWLDPLLVLDEQGVRSLLASRRLQRTPAWRDWTVTSAPPAWLKEADDGAELFKLPFVFDPAWRNFWDPSLDAPGGFNSGLVTRSAPFRVSREVRLRADKPQWLVAAAYRPLHENEEVWLEVKLDGVSLGRVKAPLREGGRRDYEPLVFSLPKPIDGKDRIALLEVIQEPTKGQTPVVWAGLELRSERPRVRMLIDEEIRYTLKTADGEAALIAPGDAWFGKQSARLKSGRTYHLTLDPPLDFRTSNDYSTPRYLQFAFRKKQPGRFGLVLHHAGDVERPLRYHFGHTPYVFQPAVGAFRETVGENWNYMQRDVVSDFGNVKVTGLSIHTPDEGDLLIDRVCWGSHPSPLIRILEQRRTGPPLAEHWDQFQKRLNNHIRAALVHLQAPSGVAFTGALVSSSGEILASPQCLQMLAGASAKVTLSDGREVKAKPIGLAKPFNCGLLKIDGEGSWPYLAIANQAAYRPGDLAVAAQATSPSDRQLSPQEVTDQSDAAVWLRPLEAGEATCDRNCLLLDQYGAVVGFSVGDSPFGARVVRCRELPAQMEALRKNELKGDWAIGAEPTIGARFQLHEEGLEVAAVDDDSPAMKADLKQGDIVVRFADLDTRSPSDIVAAAAKRGHGERVSIRIRRGDETKELTITLGAP